jgi:hypothetical protein
MEKNTIHLPVRVNDRQLGLSFGNAERAVDFLNQLRTNKMNTTPKDGGGPAFPEVRIRSGDNYNAPTKIYYSGMSLRDWLAGQALAGMATHLMPNEQVAANAVEIADLVLAELKKGAEV